ncbi:HAD family hydrolase [Clostridium saudiense]|uniref:HAD family hydrolase n=1 Tax=Clostridium saudiense TaxID=1414720 RepID=UPI0018A985C6|nr:HAD family hydrolase [Clostridium saudiense]
MNHLLKESKYLLKNGLLINNITKNNSLTTDTINLLSNIKLIVSDLDGTFLNSSGELSKANKNISKLLSKHNIKFSLASGRSDLMCQSFIKDCNITIPTISSNGALIRNIYDETIIHKTTINPSTAIDIMDFCHSHSLDYMSYNLDQIFFTKKSLRIEKFKIYNEIAKLNNTPEIKLNFYNNNHNIIAKNGVLKILLFTKSEDELNMTIEFLNKFPEISFILSEKNALDISCAGTSKGEALKLLCSYLNIPLENTCVFGDYTNDISMMKLAGVSFAMLDSPQIVQKSATFLTDSNDNSGVARAIEFILNKFY